MKRFCKIVVFCLLIKCAVYSAWMIIDNINYEDKETFTFPSIDYTNEDDENENTVNYRNDYNDGNNTKNNQSTENQNSFKNQVDKNEKYNSISYNSTDNADLIRKKREENVTKDTDQEAVSYRIINESQPVSEEIYDYYNLKAEYDTNLEEAKKKAEELDKLEFEATNKTCNADGFFDVGLQSVACLIELRVKGAINGGELLSKLYHIFLFWFILMGTIYSICFCYFGYLRCCCPFEVCFPEYVLDDTKHYLVLNPPGVKTEFGLRRYYKPTETELYLYSILWNDIYRD